ncbi:MAG: hypothetical protein AAFO07_24755, partial [Bacteroidota bacterium]
DAIDNFFNSNDKAGEYIGGLIAKGDIYNEIATQFVTIKQIGIGDVNELPKTDNAPYTAFQAYSTALPLAEKGGDKKKALDGLKTAQTNMSQIGIMKFEEGDYANAYKDFKGVVDAHKLLKDNGEASAIDGDDNYNQQMYITGLAAASAGMNDEASSIYQELYDKGFEKAAVYDQMYKMNAPKDPEAAYKYLEKGRELFPDDIGLLFTEINHFLRLEKMDVLVEKIKLAQDKEPNNKSLYYTLGNVYDQTYQNKLKESPEEAQEYFDLAMEQYEKAQNVDPKFAEASYGMGALYYNKAAIMTQELQTLSDDYSKEGLKKFDALKADILAEFDKALPHFQKAESINPNDVNTLIALKEIYARKDDVDMSNEFKTRLENVQSGANNDSSYFNK